MSDAPQLLVVRDFLTPEELSLFKNFFENRCEWEQVAHADFTERQHYARDITEFKGSPEYADIYEAYERIALRKKETLEGFFGETLAQPVNMALRKWVVGDYQSAHSDVGHPDGKLIIRPAAVETGPLSLHQYDVAAVLYFNDEFEGGEIYFPHFKKDINPEPGMFVAFPASHHYLHGVATVRSGARYVQTSFWPYSRTIVHNLVPQIPRDWWKRFANSSEILDFLPEEVMSELDSDFLPPDYR
jgi:hypothetical protein